MLRDTTITILPADGDVPVVWMASLDPRETHPSLVLALSAGITGVDQKGQAEDRAATDGNTGIRGQQGVASRGRIKAPRAFCYTPPNVTLNAGPWAGERGPAGDEPIRCLTTGLEVSGQHTFHALPECLTKY